MRSSRMFNQVLSLGCRRTLLTSAFSRRPVQMVFSEAPMPKETKSHFHDRLLKKITHTLQKSDYANHILFMSYPTRISKQQETLANAAKRLGTKKITEIELGLTENTVLPGHCLMTLIDEKGSSTADHTFSLRPDMTAKPLYQATTASDERLPKTLLTNHTAVRRAIHTTMLEELQKWVNTAFYVWHVHHERPVYPLTCFLKPIDLNEKKRYLETVTNLKLSYPLYSLLDHLHPYTGTSNGQIVAGQNCTVVFKLFEALSTNTINIHALLGDNPTPQLVTEVVRKLYFQFEKNEIRQSGELIELTDDELARSFQRRIGS